MEMDKQQSRVFKWQYTRLNWEEHLAELNHTGRFYSFYHMKEASFDNLVDILRPFITINEARSRASTTTERNPNGNTPIYPELVIAVSLAYMGGDATPKFLGSKYGISWSHCRYLIGKFIDAVIDCPELEFKLPQTEEEYRRLAEEINSVSTSDGIFFGCLGPIDGWLCLTQKPNIERDADHLNGHYQRYGLNVQALCDANLRFLYFAVAGGGKLNDGRAIRRCTKLQEWLHNLPDSYFIVGDNAYALSNKLLVPFRGPSKNEVYNSSYNYHLSQIRIRIEMAFGLLTTKWRIFRSDLNLGPEYNEKVPIVGALLHNYVIDHEGGRYDFTVVNDLNELGIDGFNPDGNDNGFLALRPVQQVQHRSTRREMFVQQLRDNDKRRPVLHSRFYIDGDSDYEDGDDEDWDN
jgi:hypothetical protein